MRKSSKPRTHPSQYARLDGYDWYVAPPRKGEGQAVGFRVDQDTLAVLQAVIASKELPWKNHTDALRFFLADGLGRLEKQLKRGEISKLCRALAGLQMTARVEAKALELKSALWKFQTTIAGALTIGDHQTAEKMYNHLLETAKEVPDKILKEKARVVLDDPAFAGLKQDSDWDGEL